jgi:RND superfamily putative drug exporter
VAVILLAVAPLAALGGRLTGEQSNDAAAYLPAGAEATTVAQELQRFTGTDSTPAVLVYTRPSGITHDDQIRITSVLISLTDELSDQLAGPPEGPLIASDGQAAEVVLRLLGSDPVRLRTDVDALRATAGQTPGLELHVTGPAAALTDLTEVFNRLDGTVLVVAVGAVLLILVFAYRSPVLPVIVLGVAGLALAFANGVTYLLVSHGVLAVSGDTQGVLDVLVIGAGTDYALLLTARYRDELRHNTDQYAAMSTTVRACAAPVTASGATVALALLCLLACALGSTRALGPVAAIGIGAAVAAMLGLLPLILAMAGRRAFWPYRPRYATATDPAGGRWAARVGRHPRRIWLITVAILGALAYGVTGLHAHGVPRTASFLSTVDSTTGQDILTRHFAQETATPVLVTARYPDLDTVTRLTYQVDGVAKVSSYVDPLEAIQRHDSGLPAPPPMQVDGRGMLLVTIGAPPDSPRATSIVAHLRTVLHAVPGAATRVGGYTATNLDVQSTAARDRLVVIPLVLGLVLVVLALLLRSVVAPLLLVASVTLSYLATLGACGIAFALFGFAGADASFPLYTFVFLVALGADYTIFLMARAREEVPVRGHRAGVQAALAGTGPVITSAGVVLAATFAVLAVLPLVFLAELAFAVAFGVLLDTLVVRTLLVPALVTDLGRIVWWPGRLSHADP